MNVIAVDVGTTSVRVAIVAFKGQHFNEVNVLASSEKDICHRQDGVQFEQSSREIWHALCECCKICLSKSDIQSSSIGGIAFSATCSLVIYDENSNAHDDIIMWMDHRAIEEAQEISQSGSDVLQQFGGICSPEFSLSKLSWLNKKQPKRLETATAILELPDWLVFRCIKGDGENEDIPQSLCCVTCKWGYDAEKNQHCDIVRSFGLKIAEKLCKRRVLEPGTVSGMLSAGAAIELGLLSPSKDKENAAPYRSQVIVGTSLIDAHSGMLAMLSVPLVDLGLKLQIDSTFCSLAGTSTCHMSLSRQKKFTRGIWGPYKNVVIDDYYLLEAGQSMTGKLIDMCIEAHEEGKQLLRSGKSVRDIIKMLNEQIDATGSTKIASGLHIMPTFHGNRSPLANPRLKGGIYGLSAERQANLLELYVATVESIVYETKFIVETLGARLDTMLVSGGLMKNTFYMQTLADVLNCKAVKLALKDVDFMVMGSGLIARNAILSHRAATIGCSGFNKILDRSLQDIRYEQLSIGKFEPRNHTSGYHDKKYRCYKEFVTFSMRVDSILN